MGQLTDVKASSKHVGSFDLLRTAEQRELWCRFFWKVARFREKAAGLSPRSEKVFSFPSRWLSASSQTSLLRCVYVHVRPAVLPALTPAGRRYGCGNVNTSCHFCGLKGDSLIYARFLPPNIYSRVETAPLYHLRFSNDPTEHACFGLFFRTCFIDYCA